MKNNSDVANELLKLKEKIEQTKAEKNRVEGELRQLSKSMMDEFKTDKPKEVQAKVEGLKKQAEALRVQIDKELSALREELGEV